jgi:BMFP domain-containing protein YqiC
LQDRTALVARLIGPRERAPQGRLRAEVPARRHQPSHTSASAGPVALPEHVPYISHARGIPNGTPARRRVTMQTENRLLDDLARMANGALNTLSGLREEFETRVRERVERILADMDMVPREEFEAVRAMAQKARTEQEDLAAKIAGLERKVAKLSDTIIEKPKRPATRARAGKASPTAP